MVSFVHRSTVFNTTLYTLIFVPLTFWKSVYFDIGYFVFNSYHLALGTYYDNPSVRHVKSWIKLSCLTARYMPRVSLALCALGPSIFQESRFGLSPISIQLYIRCNSCSYTSLSLSHNVMRGRETHVVATIFFNCPPHSDEWDTIATKVFTTPSDEWEKVSWWER